MLHVTWNWVVLQWYCRTSKQSKQYICFSIGDDNVKRQGTTISQPHKDLELLH